MKLTADQEADVLHVRLVDIPVEESEEVAPGVIVDYDESSRVVGIEILGLSKRRLSGELVGFPILGHFEDACSD